MKYYGCVIDSELKRELKRREHKKRDTFTKRLYYPVFKRTADLVCSFFALIVLCILFPFVAIAIKAESKGPIIFSQLRVGQYGNLIKIYKLRTMQVNAEDLIDKRIFQNNENPFIQKKDDPRVTRVGKVLRKYSIDELPQLFCVLKGTMSFIGPRPFIEEETQMLTKAHLKRLTVKPGLTGLAQISGRNELSLEQRIEKDIDYIDHMSPLLDIKILWLTIWRMLQGEKGM